MTQVLHGFDTDEITRRLDGKTVGISVGPSAAASQEGRSAADMLVRLLSRLYPSLSIVAEGALGESLRSLAAEINPLAEISTDLESHISVVIGPDAKTIAPIEVGIGSNGWTAKVSTGGRPSSADTGNPVGAGLAACLGAANVFRFFFVESGSDQLDREAALSGLSLESESGEPLALARDLGDTFLIGAGAIGEAAIWTLSRASVAGGVLHIVDPDLIDLGNLQRYVLAKRADEGTAKTGIAIRAFEGLPLRLNCHDNEWEDYVARTDYQLDQVLVAVDSAQVRRDIQASLPRWVANAWTQPGDLGLSEHPWNGESACLACLYLPDRPAPNEDEVIADALHMAGPLQKQAIRQLLHQNAPLSQQFLSEVAAANSLPVDILAPYMGQPVRTLYVEGFCGGALVPAVGPDSVRNEVHVPLAHQSAMAGVLLAGRALIPESVRTPTALVARVDLMRPLSALAPQRIAKDRLGRCICQDGVYRRRWEEKYKR
jgi:molybdopterin/thiamine biosynthesis adenylyltransferase